jgi:hypothetical protein
MRAWIVIPKGGINLHGVAWPSGPREITDAGWYKLLTAHGAGEITEAEYNDLTTPPVSLKPAVETQDEEKGDDGAAGTPERGEGQATAPVRRPRAGRGAGRMASGD